MEVVRLRRRAGNGLCYDDGRLFELSPLRNLGMGVIPPCSKGTLAKAVQLEAEQLAGKLHSPPDMVFYDAHCLEVEVNPDSFEARGGNIGQKMHVFGIQLYRLK